MLQISNEIYCDDIFKDMYIENKILTNPYYDLPFLIVKNFLSNKLAMEIVSYTKKSNDYKKAQIIANDSSITEGKLKEEFRKTNIYKLNDTYENIYKKRFEEIKPLIEKHFNLILTNSTDIQVLEYTKGCYYKKHADDSSELVDTKGNTVAFKNVNIERKISSVLFATEYNDNIDNEFTFNGGELKFNYLYNIKGEQIQFKPSFGDMIIFPSNPIFSHEILKVNDGYRLTLVQWHDAIIS